MCSSFTQLLHTDCVNFECHEFRFAFVHLAALLCNHSLSVCTAAKGLSLWMNGLNKPVTAQTCWLCIDSRYSDPSFLLASVWLQIYNVMFYPHMTIPLKHKVTQYSAFVAVLLSFPSVPLTNTTVQWSLFFFFSLTGILSRSIAGLSFTDQTLNCWSKCSLNKSFFESQINWLDCNTRQRI